ncbi:MAG: hypothetical protein HRT44_10390, partial [Bdellovibrionales bacterium]|nr:hypothetical protein [Bdellovibrionales bacterium]NQZ19648.1 hypothetical protein [Bdellovibrionales bacterium]
ELMASIDGLGDRFEYMRFPAKWDEVEENLLKFSSIQHIDFSICNTVSNLNVFYLPEFASWAKANGFDYWYNILHGPEWFCLNQLPEKIKEAVTIQIRDIPLTEPLISFMNTEPKNKLFAEFGNNIKKSDLYRGESFSKTFPEFFQLIKDADATSVL